MEKRGAINRYVPYNKTDRMRLPCVYIINLAHGVTPFIHMFDPADLGRKELTTRIEYCSDLYRLDVKGNILVTHGHYRPGREEFDKLEISMQEHVLNGGLLCAKLETAIINQLPGDKDIGDDFQKFQVFCLMTYGKTLVGGEDAETGQ